MKINNHEVFAFIKPSLDAHTLGISYIAEILRECGYKVVVADETISRAVNDLSNKENVKLLIRWIKYNDCSLVGLSYRLDVQDAISITDKFVDILKSNRLFNSNENSVKFSYFAGLPGACDAIDKKYAGTIKTFKGGETPKETLLRMGVPESSIPTFLTEGCHYDELRMQFGKSIIDEQAYLNYVPVNSPKYPEYGTKKDSLLKRLQASKSHDFAPLIRAHVGPYSSKLSREESVNEFLKWTKKLAEAKYLDILSIGSSQLTQSDFGQSWGNKINGGGVPINSPDEFRKIWEVSRPLLLRTYAGTTNIRDLAEMYEETINMSWHALSLWWFNKLDERGPYDVYTNLKQQIETIKYIAKIKKPFEPNVPHHFAFRGADDITYVVSAYLASKLAKTLGIKTLILQNMLNTPRTTWGFQDLAKSRAMLKLVRALEDKNFKVILQPRAGLDYFSSDLYEAKIQLAAVTALMDDIEPNNEISPSIIHVVSYTEGQNLATPDVIDESIKITQYSLQKYRELKKTREILNMSENEEVNIRMIEIVESAKQIISAIETSIDNPYSAEGLYTIFASGFLPTPYIWNEIDEFKNAKFWKTKVIKGSVKLVDDQSEIVNTEKRIQFAKQNIPHIEELLREKNQQINKGF